MSAAFSWPECGRLELVGAKLPWYAICVKPNFEQTTSSCLSAKGYEHFVPTYRVRRKWSDRVKEIQRPLFPGYVFCRFPESNRLPVMTTTGVRSIVAFGRQLAAVDDSEIESIRAILNSQLEAQPWPFLQTGRKIEVCDGPLRGVEGIVVETKNGSRLVASITLLQRAVSVEIERAWVRPI